MVIIFPPPKIHHEMYALVMEFHLEQLQKHCRICGNRLSKSKGSRQPVYCCADFSEDLATCIGIRSVPEDDGVLLPPKFCNNCFMKLRRVKKAKESGTPSHQIQPMEWTSHTDDCTVREYEQ